MTKIRYCRTNLQQIMPCQVGWGISTETLNKCCLDEPMEENCYNIVDTEDESIPQYQCPLCGSLIKIVKGNEK